MYLRFPGGNSRLGARCARVRRSERHGKFACESVLVLRGEQLRFSEQKRTAFTRPEREFIDSLFVSSFLKKRSGFNFVMSQYFQTFLTFGVQEFDSAH